MAVFCSLSVSMVFLGRQGLTQGSEGVKKPDRVSPGSSADCSVPAATMAAAAIRDHPTRRYPCGPSRNSTYLPPSPVSEIPRIRYRCKAIARAAVGIIEIVDAAMMSCH